MVTLDVWHCPATKLPCTALLPAGKDVVLELLFIEGEADELVVAIPVEPLLICFCCWVAQFAEGVIGAVWL